MEFRKTPDWSILSSSRLPVWRHLYLPCTVVTALPHTKKWEVPSKYTGDLALKWKVRGLAKTPATSDKRRDKGTRPHCTYALRFHSYLEPPCIWFTSPVWDFQGFPMKRPLSSFEIPFRFIGNPWKPHRKSNEIPTWKSQLGKSKTLLSKLQ